MTWLKDNRPLSDRLADRITITEENFVHRLEIKNITESDSGTYTARAENDCGVSFSTAHLIVEKCTFIYFIFFCLLVPIFSFFFADNGKVFMRTVPRENTSVFKFLEILKIFHLKNFHNFAEIFSE